MMVMEHECKYEGIVKETHQMVKDIHKVIYVGNGKDSLVTSIDRNTTGRKVMYWFSGAVVLGVLGVGFKLIYNSLAG